MLGEQGRGKGLFQLIEEVAIVINGIAVTPAFYTVPFGEGKANVHDVLAELTRQNYFGILATELEQEQIVLNPMPTVEKGKKYIDGITYYKGWNEILP